MSNTLNTSNLNIYQLDFKHFNLFFIQWKLLWINYLIHKYYFFFNISLNIKQSINKNISYKQLPLRYFYVTTKIYLLFVKQYIMGSSWVLVWTKKGAVEMITFYMSHTYYYFGNMLSQLKVEGTKLSLPWLRGSKPWPGHSLSLNFEELNLVTSQAKKLSE